ncbi:hypothetical protein [Robiginitalea sp. SC105]|uniref:hypothetical protein n=1 Tax=Robiginitalea sp. SC105 TaxID=2762332 RepID=UPI00163AFB87|nr:hypothetical protein [Robiginitalea sp. SC105]MBC2840089.1 hypothetical protein [Robiginitalea sp. SC105]
MIEFIHKHITSELQQNTKTDIIFIITSIVLNLIVLAVNSGMSEESKDDQTFLVVMILFVVLLILLNAVVIVGLHKGKQTRSKLLSGLLKMYKDQNVEKYYDSTLMGNYNTRYNLFMLVVVLTGIIAIIVPFVLR